MDFIFMLLGLVIGVYIFNNIVNKKISKPDLCSPSHTWRYDIQGLMFCEVCKRYVSEITEEGVER